MIRQALIPLSALLLLATPLASVRADVLAADYARVNRALTDGVALPGYRRLAEAAGRFEKAAAGHCTSPRTVDLAAVKHAYGTLMDAWMLVQPINFGPIELFMRNFRIHFWPSGSGRVEKALTETLSAKSPLSAEALRRASIAVQGIPAAELLIYGERSKGLRPGSRSCTLLMAIAGNVAAIARDLVADWSGGRIDFRRSVLETGGNNPYFSTPREASLAYFKSLYRALDLIVAAKLGPVAGGAKKGTIDDLESVASGRSLRNIALNIEAARALYLGPNDDGFTAIVRAHGRDPKLDPLMRRAFELTLATARSFRGPIAAALKSPSERRKIDKLMLQCRALKQIIATRLATALGLAVGFNARDGD